jgi:putative transposase
MSCAPEPDGYLTRNYLVPLDVNGHQDRLLNSYCGAHRFCWNWLLAQVKENLDTVPPSAPTASPMGA